MNCERAWSRCVFRGRRSPSVRLFLYILLAVAVAGFRSAPALAQVEAGTISGTVHDATGAVIAGANVTAKNVATSVARTVQSGENGQYNLPGLAPGIYAITVTSTGFASFTARAELTVGAHTTLDAQLSVSGQTTTVEVVAAGGAEVNTQTQEISQVISQEQVQQLPSLTRNPYDFVAIAGNVSGGDRTNSGNPQTSGGGQNNTDRGVGFSLNGQRSSGTEVLLDGVENTNIFDTTVALVIPADAVQEFRVVTNNFDAQYGRASGGVVNLVTRTGTNSLHGSAWEFNRLSAYTANTFDNVISATPKGSYTRNQFGYTIGGPVKKDKLFFFSSTEWLRVRSSASLLGYVPTPQLLAATASNVQAYFTKYGGSLPFISTVTKAQLNFNPAGPFDNAIAAGTPVFGLVHYNAPSDAGGDLPQNTYDLVGRADYNMSSKTQMFFRFGRESNVNFPGSVFNSPYPQYNVGLSIYDNSYLYSLSHSFTPNVFSNTKLSFFRDTVGNQYNGAQQNTPTLFLYNNASILNQPVTLPGYYDATTGTGGLPFGGPQNTVQLTEDLGWTKGRHIMRYGGQVNYIQLNRGYGAYAQAIEELGKNQPAGLDNLITGNLALFQVAVDPKGKFPCVRDPNTGQLIASPNCTVSLPASAPSFNRDYRYKDWAAYAQDTWKLTPRFTFNYGVRYEYYGVQHNGDQKLDSNFYFGSGSTFYQRVRNGSVQPALSSPIGKLWNPTYGAVGPRVGFAYDVFGNGKTSLRGGYGISYERNFGNVTFNMIQNPPNYATPSVLGSPANPIFVTTNNLGPLGGSSGSVLLPPVSPRNVDQNIKTAQTQFWGLAVERQLAHRSIFSVEYNSAHGVHLYDIKNINELGGGQAYLGDAFDGTHYSRPNQQFTSINNRGTNGFSHYNALNVRFQTQDFGSTGLSVVTNYTWAHALDNISSTFSESSSGSNGVGNLGYLDPRNPALDYGNSDFDIRHRLVLSAIWNEPYFKSSRGWLSQVAGGYSVVPIFTARTGTSFTVSDSTNSLNLGLGGIPRYVPAGTISSFATGSGVDQGGNVFNLLTLPVANSFGNTALGGISDFGPFPSNMTARNAFRGPGGWNLDLALGKFFTLTERMKLEFRAEGFNILNHHNMYVNGFNADFGSFGTSTGLVITGKKGGLGALANNGNHDERRFGQFALRLSF